MKKVNRYTREDYELVAKMFRQGMSYKQISEKTGFPEGSIKHMLSHAGIEIVSSKNKKEPKGHVNPDSFKLMKDMSKYGATSKVIALAVKLHPSTVADVLRFETVEEYKEMLAEKYAKSMAAQTKPVETKAEVTPAKVDFDQYNTLMTKINAMQYDLARLIKLVEATQVKKFGLF